VMERAGERAGREGQHFMEGPRENLSTDEMNLGEGPDKEGGPAT
jgi:hypothetical protein